MGRYCGDNARETDTSSLSMRRERIYRPYRPEDDGATDGDKVHWYVGLVASTPSLGGAMRAWLPEGAEPPTREDRAAAVIAHAGHDDGVRLRVPTFLRDPRKRSPVGRPRVIERVMLFPGYLFLGVPDGVDPRTHGFAPDVGGAPALAGFLTLDGLPQYVDRRVVERVCREAEDGVFDNTQATRKARASALKAGVTVSVAESHPYFAGHIGAVERADIDDDGEGRVVMTIGRTRVSFAAKDVAAG